MKKSKLGTFLLVGIMLLSLAACSGNASAPSDGTDTASDGNHPTASAPQSDTTQPSHAGTGTDHRSIKLTLAGDEGVQEITATLMDTPAAAEFTEHMPFTVKMYEHCNRQKAVYLDFSLSRESQTNSVCEYEIGDIAYWHPGPTLGIFHSHDGCSISAGVEILAKLDEGGVETITSYADLVSVTFELDESGSGSPAGMDQKDFESLSPYVNDVKATVTLTE